MPSLVRINSFVAVISLMLVALAYANIEESDVDPKKLPPGMDPASAPPGLKQFSFSPPKLSEEEQESPFFPASLKCDGCRAVAFQIFIRFYHLYTKNKNNGGKAKESDIIEIFENGCNAEIDTYAVKEVNGVLKMVGPGLPSRQDEAGVMQGGGKIPGRIRNLCHEFRGEFGEDELYSEFLKLGADRYKLEGFLCRNAQQSLTTSCLTSGAKPDAKQEL